MHSSNDYLSSTIRQLRDQQVRYAPREKKLEQVARAEKLISELHPARTYSYEYLCYRITDYRPENSPLETMSGDDANHDLNLFVEDVSDAADVRVDEAGEPVHTMEELSKMFQVSTKTISRWRKQGLVSRRFLMDGRKRVGFLHSSVQRFANLHEDKVRRGRNFTQLSTEERDEIIERARRLARAGGCPKEITRRIAKHMGRTVETIRYTLRQFEVKNPQMAVFPDYTKPLTVDVKEKIYRNFRRGVSAAALAERYCRTKNSIYRIINEMRARRIMELPLDFIHNEQFERTRADKEILGPMPEPEERPRQSRPPANLPPYLAALYDTPLLTREQEQHIFRKMNYLKFCAEKLRRRLDPAHPSRRLMDQIEERYDQGIKVKNQIVQANLRLVVSIAKRHVTASDDLFQLISDGNMSLIRAVEKFDYARGNKFSTYASWAIMKNYARSIPDEFRHRDRYRTSTDEAFIYVEDDRADRRQAESTHSDRREQIEKILSQLDDREQQIIISRFGLDYEKEPLTLKEVGAEIGVTKERVRQIEARALNKLRIAARDEHIDFVEEES